MIKLVSVSTDSHGTVLTFLFDKDGENRNVSFLLSDVLERLKAVKQKLGRPVTLADLKLAIIQVINEVRDGKSCLSERFDLSQFIGVDLE
jgi:glycerol dehydrogenase-like iron-containing ADH family enzyme